MMNANLFLGQALYFPGTKKCLTILRGIPGAGKSTYARSMSSIQGGPVHLEADMWFSRDGEYRWDPELIKRAHRWCIETTEVLLQTRGLVVVSNTFTMYNEMFDYLDFCYKHKIGCNIVTLTSSYGSIHSVPEEAMERMRKRFQSHQDIMERVRVDYPQ